MNVIIGNKYQAMLAQLDIDVIKSMYGEFEVDELIDTFSNFFFNRMVLDITSIKNYKDISTLQKLSANLDMNKVILVLDESEESASSAYLSKLISLGIYNFSRNIETIKYLITNPNSYKDVAHIHQVQDVVINTGSQILNSQGQVETTKVIGVKNLTNDAGATTLIYMLKKQIQDYYSVLAIEIDRKDFALFNEPNMISTTSEGFPLELLKAKDYDVILIDLNDSDNAEACHDVLYLVEPSTIKLNKMIRRNRNVFEKLKDKKIVLNKSLLTNSDISDFEYEAKIRVFYNLPPIDDKQKNYPVLNDFLIKLGFEKMPKNNR